MAALLHVRLIVVDALRDDVLDFLDDHVGTTNIVVVDDAARQPPGHVVLFDVAREASNEVLRVLQDLGVHRHGTINVVHPHLSIGAAADRAHREAPGEGDATVLWAEVESVVAADCRPTHGYLLYFAVAAVIAAVGLIVDSPVLMVGAMVVGPEYGPVAAIAYFLQQRRLRAFVGANVTLFAGTGVAVALAAALTLVLRATGRVDAAFELGDQPFTGFVSHPDVYSAIVAGVAAVAGVFALTHERAGTLVGVLVSVTTIPAIAAIGVSAAVGDWPDAWGAALQFALNATCLIVVGALTLAVLHRLTPRTLSVLARGIR